MLKQMQQMSLEELIAEEQSRQELRSIEEEKIQREIEQGNLTEEEQKSLWDFHRIFS